MAERQVEGSNPLGKDGVPGGDSQVDVKKYHTFMVNSTKHLFSAPHEKYTDLKAVLGLTDVDTDDKKQEGGLKLAQGSGYVYLNVAVKGGSTLKVVCDPAKVGDALKTGASKKVYGKDINRIYIPKKRVLI